MSSWRATLKNGCRSLVGSEFLIGKFRIDEAP